MGDSNDGNFNDSPELLDKYRQWYRNRVLRYGRNPLRTQLGRGGIDQTRQYRNAAVSSEAQGVREMGNQSQLAMTRNFGGNPSGMAAALPVQAQLASKRPVIEVQAQEAGRRATLDAVNRLQALEMGQPAYTNAQMQPHFQEEYLDYLFDSLFPPMQGEGDSGGGGLFGGI